VFVLVHNIRRRWLARKQSISAVKSRLISFSEIPFTIRDTSGGGRHFYLFSYLNEFVRGDSMGNSRTENASDGNMILQAVSFERFAINSSYVLVGSSKRQQRNVVPEKCTLSPSSSSSSLALSLGDIQLSLTILLKRKQRIGTTQSTTEEESRCARSITVSLKIKSLEFGCFPYLFDRVQVRGVGFDVDAVFASVTSVDKANSNVTGIGMSVSCKRVGMNTFCSNEKRIGRPPFLGSSTKRSNVVSWDAIQSTFYDQRLLSGFDDYSALERTNVALVSLPMGYFVVQPADVNQSPPISQQQSPSTRQALVSLGRGSSTKDELTQHLALGIDFEATHRFIPLMELLLQNAFCSLVRNNTQPTDVLIEVSTKTKLKTTSKIELVEVNATGYASLYALLSKSSHDVDIGHGHEAVSMKAANTTAQWRKRNSLDSNSSFNRAVPNNSSAVALVIVKDLCVYCHSSLDSDLDIIRIVGVSLETAWWLQQVENKPLPRTSADVGGVLLRLDSEVIGRFARLNNDLQTTKVLGNALQRRLNGLDRKLPKDQVDGLKRKINHPSFDALNLSCASVDAIVELQIPSESNNNNNDNNNNNNNKSSTTNTTTVKIWRPSTSPTDTGHSNGSMYCADAVRYVMTREVVQHQQTPTVELLMEWNQLGMDTKEWIYDFVLEKFGSLHGQEVVVEGRLNFDYEMRRGSENGPWADLIPFDGRDLWQFTLINNDSHEDNMWQADPASFVNLGRKERARCWPWSEGDELPFRRTGADAPMTGNGPNGAISVHVNLGPFLSHKRESNDPKSYQASAA